MSQPNPAKPRSVIFARRVLFFLLKIHPDPKVPCFFLHSSTKSHVPHPPSRRSPLDPFGLPPLGFGSPVKLPLRSSRMQRHDLGARVDLRPMQRQFPYVPAEGRQFWMYATATTCPVEVLEQWPKGFDNPDCEKFAPGENKVSVFVDSTRPSIQALKWLGKVIPLLEEAKWYQGLIKGLERWTVGNHKGFVATDDTLKAIIVSVSGTGMVTNLGFFADVLADTNANSLYGLECPILQIQKKLKFVPYIKKLPGLYHRGFCWFYNMMVLYTSYQTDLITAVKANPSYDVIFAGHSLGGL